jgi:dimethylamine/trimethylamine dehydrogenase
MFQGSERVLIIGGGPAGLEAARACAQRGLEVVLAEAGGTWGGRVARECRLPGLASWQRVCDWRLGQLRKLGNVEMYLASHLSAEEVLAYDIRHIALATGALWRRDGIGRTRHQPVPGLDAGPLLTPDDIMAEGFEDRTLPSGALVVYDDDGYVMGAVMAEKLASAGHAVTLVTPAPLVSAWTVNTLEQPRIHRRLAAAGVTIVTNRLLGKRSGGRLELACSFTARPETIDCAALLVVTARLPDERLYLDLKNREDHWPDAGIETVRRLGDACAPGTVAAAVFAGHRYAREFGETLNPDQAPFRRESIELAN